MAKKHIRFDWASKKMQRAKHKANIVNGGYAQIQPFQLVNNSV